MSMLWPRSWRLGGLRTVEGGEAGACGRGLRERLAELYTSSALGLGGVVWRLEKEAESLPTSLCPRLWPGEWYPFEYVDDMLLAKLCSEE